jgi:RimJ/RimL family protein N-acetyltransferase
MQEVLPMIINYGFKTMGLNFIDGEVDIKNIKSIKLMEKNDFVFNKTLKNTQIYLAQNPNTNNY